MTIFDNGKPRSRQPDLPPCPYCGGEAILRDGEGFGECQNDPTHIIAAIDIVNGEMFTKWVKASRRPAAQKTTLAETIADIASEMRNATVPDYMFNGEEVAEPLISGQKVRQWADRIEAAGKRDHLSRRAIKVPIEVLPTGNAAAMFEALMRIEKMAHCDLCNVYPQYRDKFNGIIGGIEREARTALAASPRNCDVGTPDEQGGRFDRFCHAAGWDNCSKACPLYAHSRTRDDCAIQWANMLFTDHASNVNKPSAVDTGENKEDQKGGDK